MSQASDTTDGDITFADSAMTFHTLTATAGDVLTTSNAITTNTGAITLTAGSLATASAFSFTSATAVTLDAFYSSTAGHDLTIVAETAVTIKDTMTMSSSAVSITVRVFTSFRNVFFSK